MLCALVVADPGFLRGLIILFDIIFAENCMKMKILDWEGEGHASLAP